MSYVRFGEGSDLYVFAHVGGFIQCCACRLAPLVKTVFTEGCKDHPLFGDKLPCEKCGGEGCDACMMHGNTDTKTKSEMIEHVKAHISAGHSVPDYVIPNLQKDIEEYGDEEESLYEDGYAGPVVTDLSTGETKKLTEFIDGIEESDENINE